MGKECMWVGGLGHVFDGKLYFTRSICEEKWIPTTPLPCCWPPLVAGPPL